MEQKLNKLKRKITKNKAADAELFKIHGLLEYGFPPDVSALAYDQKLKLLAVATSRGEVRLYGAPGVQFLGKTAKPVHIFQLLFVPDQGRIIAQGLEGDSSVICLFETKTSKDGSDSLELVNTVSVEKRVTTCSLTHSNDLLLIGTDAGDVYKLELKSFQKLEDDVIHQDVAMQNVPDDFKVSPGGVEAIELHPIEENLVLIGYGKGLLVLWDLVDSIPQGTFFTSCKGLESVAWYKDASRFLSAHEDGTYLIWEKDPEQQYGIGPKRVFPYGDEESGKKIAKIQALLDGTDDEYLIFAGGLPKDTYSTTNSVTVKKGDQEVVFEMSSKVVDFVTVVEEDSEKEKPSALLVLTEDELVAIDLQSAENGKQPLWPTMNKPYLNSASPSDLTSICIYEDAEQEFIDKLRASGVENCPEASPQAWPVTGGKPAEVSGKLSVLITGHYDGAVRFYDINGGKFELINTLNIADYYKSDELDDQPEHESLGDLKLRKVGSDFGACVDDSRSAICKIYVCPRTNAVFIGGHSGQMVMFELGDSSESVLDVTELKIVADEVNFKWKGCHPLGPKDIIGNTFPVGFKVSAMLQAEPPAPVTSMAVNTEWGIVAIGTNHGFGVYDLKNKKVLLTKNTLVENDDAASGAKLSKSKSLREGIRNSFRRLKPKKAEPAAGTSSASAEQPKSDEPEKPKDEPKPAEAGGDDKPAEATEGVEDKAQVDAEGDSKPAEEAQEKKEEPAPAAAPVEEPRGNDRVVAARAEQDKTLQSTVRYLSFADTFLRNTREHNPSVWVGTHAGTVYAFIVDIPEDREKDVKLSLAKEIRLHHKAPIVFMSVLDHSGFPLPDPAAVKAGKQNAADMSGHHHLLVCSEEQVKLFTLPALKGKYKEKLTAVEGMKVRKVSPIKVRQDDVSHNFVACMLNEGQVSIFSLPSLFCQYKENMVNKDNKVGTLYTEFTSDAAAYTLESTNLIKAFGLAKDVEPPKAMVELKEGARPAMVVEVVAEEPKVEETKNEEAEAPAEGAEEGKDNNADLPTVEEEAKQMLDEAEEKNDEEFQERIKNELNPDNPEISSTTTTTYRAIESRTILSSDDGENVTKIITTTRDTTLALDGELVTQKTQQKEEFEVSPSEEKPEDNEEKPAILAGEAQEKKEELEKSSSEEMVDAPDAGEESNIVRTATLTSEKSENEQNPADESKLDDDQITHHIGEEQQKDEVDEVVSAEATVALESAPAIEKPAEDQPEEPKADDAQADDAKAEDAEADEAQGEEAQPEETPEPEGFTGQCYGGSSGRLYSPLALEEDAEKAAAEEEAPSDAVTGQCYGGSQGELYSPMAREAAAESEQPAEESEKPAEESQAESLPTENGDAPAALGNGVDEPQMNGGDSHEDSAATDESAPVPVKQMEDPSAAPAEGQVES